MNQDKIIEEATKAMHAEVCCPCDPKGCDWENTREVRHAWVLADAGLLARPLPTLSEAWEEGKRAGLQQSDWEHGDTATQYIATNPYRQERNA